MSSHHCSTVLTIASLLFGQIVWQHFKCLVNPALTVVMGNCPSSQVIAEPDDRYEAYCKSSDFIREHIFPGGHLPSLGAMTSAARSTSLKVTPMFLM